MKKTKEKPKKKPRSMRAVKKDATDAFQLYVRLRDSSLGGEPWGQCITCDKIVIWNLCDGGHFISRSKLATLFEETNVHMQCKSCNAFGGTEMIVQYGRALEERYGPGTVQGLIDLSHDQVKYNRSDYEEMTVKFKHMIAEQQERLGF